MGTIKFNLEFGGFYHSIHSNIIDDGIRNSFQDDVDFDSFYDSDEYDKIDWNSVHNEYCKIYIDILNHELDLNLKFIKLNSPRFYNFETDKIEAEISDKEFNKLKTEYLKSKEFVDYVNESSKSYDGFISFYNGIDEVKADDEILLNYMFNYILLSISDDIEMYLYDVLDGIYQSGEEVIIPSFGGIKSFNVNKMFKTVA
tara:strand:- start:3023 stop:3622 length:600 start_codon:yes stop_codon:yes gene_type:complete